MFFVCFHVAFQEHVLQCGDTRKATKQKFCGYNWVWIIFTRFDWKVSSFTGYGPFWEYGWYFSSYFHQPRIFPGPPRNFPNRISGLSPNNKKLPPPTNNQFFTAFISTLIHNQLNVHGSIITIWITNNYIQNHLNWYTPKLSSSLFENKMETTNPNVHTLR